jgi:dolichyl-diphosphooligosaccharide--protein glycosyltransferase/undecaprenyl-diphosphooligosaccharide--protein glycosyltransferase
MQTTSPEFAANLSRLAVETYVESNYSNIANTLFKNRKKDQLDPNILLTELEDTDYKLPKKTRDIYLYLPYRMLRIFPTVMVFGNLDLTTGKKLRKIVFYPTNAVKQEKATIRFANGIVFDTKEGKLLFGKEKKDVKNFIIAQSDKQGKTSLRSQFYHPDGDFAVVYMQSYGTFVVMDIKTFNSTYVQMFMLGKYDKNLFELVVSSPYTKIYKLKK